MVLFANWKRKSHICVLAPAGFIYEYVILSQGTNWEITDCNEGRKAVLARAQATNRGGEYCSCGDTGFPRSSTRHTTCLKGKEKEKESPISLRHQANTRPGYPEYLNLLIKCPQHKHSLEMR